MPEETSEPAHQAPSRVTNVQRIRFVDRCAGRADFIADLSGPGPVLEAAGNDQTALAGAGKRPGVFVPSGNLPGGVITAPGDGMGQDAEFVVRPTTGSHKISGRSARGRAGSHRQLRRKRLLVVDDNHDVAEMLSEVLQTYGYSTRVAYDGISALELAKSFRPHVALLDIGLPAMDGYQLARRLRQLPELRAIRLFAVTAYSQMADRLRSAEAGFDRHLVKPVDLRNCGA